MPFVGQLSSDGTRVFTAEGWQPVDLPGFDGDENIDFAGSTSIDIGNGIIMVLGPNGEFLGLRQAPQAPAGRTQFGSERALDIAQTERLGAQTANEQRELDQFDRELSFRIQNTQDQLTESRRQFDISTGLERERIAAQMARLKKQLANDMAIAQLDNRTRLEIAGMQAVTAKRGQNISREQFGLNLQARRAEFGATTLGRDPARQALFELGGSGGTTPLELAAQQFPTAEIPQISAAGGASVNLKDKPVAIRVGEAGRPEIVLASKKRIDIIPEAASAQGGASLIPGEPETLEPSPVIEARRTFRDLLRSSFEAGPMPQFGGLQDIEPFFGQDIEAPGKMAFSFSQKSPAVQRILLSVLGVRGFDQEEALRRMRAATPEAVFSGIARQR